MAVLPHAMAMAHAPCVRGYVLQRGDICLICVVGCEYTHIDRLAWCVQRRAPAAAAAPPHATYTLASYAPLTRNGLPTLRGFGPVHSRITSFRFRHRNHRHGASFRTAAPAEATTTAEPIVRHRELETERSLSSTRRAPRSIAYGESPAPPARHSGMPSPRKVTTSPEVTNLPPPTAVARIPQMVATLAGRLHQRALCHAGNQRVVSKSASCRVNPDCLASSAPKGGWRGFASSNSRIRSISAPSSGTRTTWPAEQPGGSQYRRGGRGPPAAYRGPSTAARSIVAAAKPPICSSVHASFARACTGARRFR
eukprot:scaffold1447_cov115-Isochrysis_galbana.AAC.11